MFAAVDTRLGRRVAVKVLHGGLAEEADFLRRFREEARIAASLDHPCIMRVFDWGEEATGPYLVTELLLGGSLRALLDSCSPLSHAQVAAIGSEAAAGLAYAERRRIIHRDIKPGNLLFDEDGHLRIADFGVARVLAAASSTERRGSVLGTARYTSPEQATGGELDGRTDVYSLALVLYECLTGRVPFSGETVPATLLARVGAVLPPAAELGPLAGVLAAAAIPEPPIARLDAGAFASELQQLTRQLPRPEALPLARIELQGPASRLEARDWTDLDPDHATRTVTLPVAGEAEGDGAPPSAAESSREAPPAAAGQRPVVAGGREGGRKPADRGSAGVRAKRPKRRRARLLAWTGGLLALAAVLATAGTLAFVHYGVYGHVVPKVDGLQVATARADLENAGLRMSIGEKSYELHVPVGHVVTQSIPAGRRERSGTVVVVAVSRGPAPVPVPGVVGWQVHNAELKLRAGHLLPKVVRLYSETVAAQHVIKQDPTAQATSESRGTTVVLYVSKGPHPRIVPGVLGLPVATAEAKLSDVQLRYVLAKGQYSTTMPAGEVVAEQPKPAESVPRGTVITLVPSLGMPFVTVPSLQGQRIATAESELQARGLHYKLYGPSHPHFVLQSVPGSGARVRMGSTVALYVI